VFKAGQQIQLGNTGVHLVIHSSGGLKIATPNATYAIMKDTSVARFSDGVVVLKNDTPVFRLLVSDNTTIGHLNVVLQFFAGQTTNARFSQFTTIRYD